MDCNILLETYNKILNNLNDKKIEINLSNDSPLLKSYLIKDYNILENNIINVLKDYNYCKNSNTSIIN